MSTSLPSTARTKPLRVYLSGGMEYALNEGRDWRTALEKWLTAELGCTTFNPNRESEKFLEENYPGLDMRSLKQENLFQFTAIVSRIVDLDCTEIAKHTDVVICYWDEAAMRGAGTKGELTMAKYSGKPVYIVTSIPATEIPGWVLGCTSKLFGSFEELKRFVAEEFGLKKSHISQNEAPRRTPSGS